MANLHIIFDPSEKIQTPSTEVAASLKLRWAAMPIPDEMKKQERKAFVERFVALFMRNWPEND